MAFSKQKRFYTPDYQGSPGPAYMLPASKDGWSENVGVPLYRGTPSEAGQLGNPSADRTAWLLGKVKGETAYYTNIEDKVGPAGYVPKMDAFLNTPPKLGFTKEARFGQLTNIAENTGNLCRFSPGPIYNPQTSVMELRKNKSPQWGMGQPSNKSRADFIHGELSKDGYLYNTSPATMEAGINISPAQYDIKETAVKKESYNQCFNKAKRFTSVSIDKKRANGRYGHESPGPIYHPKEQTIGYNRSQGKNVTPSTSWCP